MVLLLLDVCPQVFVLLSVRPQVVLLLSVRPSILLLLHIHPLVILFCVRPLVISNLICPGLTVLVGVALFDVRKVNNTFLQLEGTDKAKAKQEVMEKTSPPDRVGLGASETRISSFVPLPQAHLCQTPSRNEK